MELWLDTIHLPAIERAAQMGLLHGVTTNPAILSRAPQLDGLLSALLSAQSGPVCVQVTATHSSGMVEEGLQLHGHSPRIIVKVPVNREGLAAMHQLVRAGVTVLATAVLHPRQLLLAVQVGAHYIAPYVSHMADQGLDPWAALQTMQELIVGSQSRIMAASLRSVEQVLQCAQLHLHAVTLKDPLFAALTEDNPHSEAFTTRFHSDWHSAFPGASAAQLIGSEVLV